MNKKILIAIIALVVVALSAFVIYKNVTPSNDDATQATTDSVSPTSSANAEATEGNNTETNDSSIDTKNNNSETKKSDSPSQDANSNTSTKSDATEQPTVKPTFMYFISNNDDGYSQTKKIIDELMKEYPDIVFDIKNVDDDPSLLDHFPVKDQTPALIMLNTKNDICAFEYKCNDKSSLESIIKKALESK